MTPHVGIIKTNNASTPDVIETVIIDEWNKVGSDYGYNYLQSAITFSKMGMAFGEAMLELMGAKK